MKASREQRRAFNLARKTMAKKNGVLPFYFVAHPHFVVRAAKHVKRLAR